MAGKALVTGAGRGIGAATARELGRRGFHVVVNYRTDAGAAKQVVADIERAGGSAVAARADVRDPAQVDALVSGRGGVDVLICNANVPPPFVPLAELSWDQLRDKVDGELAAAFHPTRRVLPAMRERGAGRIVYVSSLSAELTRPGSAAHAAAKAALEAFARHVAAEAGPHGIAVNVVAPGAVRTDGSADQATAGRVAALAARSVLHRMVEPDDVAAVIGALAGGELAAVSGVRIPVDAGFRVIGGVGA
jgi:3-oxoacyl-[acyl-carrier protein] reductase